MLCRLFLITRKNVCALHLGNAASNNIFTYNLFLKLLIALELSLARNLSLFDPLCPFLSPPLSLSLSLSFSLTPPLSRHPLFLTLSPVPLSFSYMVCKAGLESLFHVVDAESLRLYMHFIIILRCKRSGTH